MRSNLMAGLVLASPAIMRGFFRASHTSSAEPAVKAILALEDLVTQDEGGRGTKPLAQCCQGNLRGATQALCDYVQSKKITRAKVLILTGFPCNMNHDEPQETDGPSGALAIARSLLLLGCDVHLLTDDCCSRVLRACTDAAVAQTSSSETARMMSQLKVSSLPPRNTHSKTEWDNTFEELLEGTGAVIAIERTGPASDGRYLTMGVKDMTHLIAPLDRLFPLAEKAGIITIGIGDGGNELGMGRPKHGELIAQHVANGHIVHCVVPAQWLIACSVSNWGGYAQAAAIAAVATKMGMGRYAESGAAVLALPTVEEEEAIVDAGVAVGMRDGVTGRLERTVDGLSWATSAAILSKARALVQPLQPRK